MTTDTFPRDFLWGVASSAYQIEGAWNEDSKGESIWDSFLHDRKMQNADVSCDNYHRFKEDIALMKHLGVKAYRFSMSWPRIIPDGTGSINQKGLDFYKRLVDGLHETGIVPVATLYHWDLPQRLEENGGWLNRETASHFENYARILFTEFKDSIPMWITHNEPRVVAYRGYGSGTNAPGVKQERNVLQVIHNLLLSHGLAVRQFRDLGFAGKIGITLNLKPVYPYTDSPEDRKAAELQDIIKNKWFLDPVLKGHYPEVTSTEFQSQYENPDTRPGDLEIISTPSDFLGVNNYSRDLVKFDPDAPLKISRIHPKESSYTSLDWEIYPKGLQDLLVNLGRDYGIDLYVTENGASLDEVKARNGQVHDTVRINYLREHIGATAKAIQDGSPVKGYFVWSLMDNLEWSLGYKHRFGLVHVDFNTLERTVKDSGYFYSRVIADNGINE